MRFGPFGQIYAHLLSGRKPEFSGLARGVLKHAANVTP